MLPVADHASESRGARTRHTAVPTGRLISKKGARALGRCEPKERILIYTGWREDPFSARPKSSYLFAAR